MSNPSVFPPPLPKSQSQRLSFWIAGGLCGLVLPVIFVCALVAIKHSRDTVDGARQPSRTVGETAGDAVAKRDRRPASFVIQPALAQRSARVAPAGALRPVLEPPPREPAVAMRPSVTHWRQLDRPKLDLLTDDDLLASLEETAIKVDLYNATYDQTNSFQTISKNMKTEQNRHSRDLEKQREYVLSAMNFDQRYKSMAKRFEDAINKRRQLGRSQAGIATMRAAYDRMLSRWASRAITPDTRKNLHALSPRIDPIEKWQTGHPDLGGLPFLRGNACKISYDAAETLGEHSRTFRRIIGSGSLRRRQILLGDSSDHPLQNHVLQTDWTAIDVPALKQILQASDPGTRLALVTALSKIDHPSATVALAQRALFDPSRRVRDEAVAALKTRPAEMYRRTLLGGFEYPWQPAATHAAEALVTLDDRGSVKYLERLLDQPDPTEPVKQPDGKWTVKELVRVNHMRNCYLCHAPSLSNYDTVRGFVPSPESELPNFYYDAPSGDFVRADITYLRQDFSVMHAVENHKPWPMMQRFDYLVRTRTLTEREAQERLRKRKSQGKLTPHRRAILYTLHTLERPRRPRVDL